MSGKNSLIKRNCNFVLTFVLYCIAGYFLKFSCPIKLLFHISCPTCGVTRALWHLFKLDFRQYMSYNAMAIPLLITVLLFLNIDLFRKKKAIYICGYIILAVNAIYYGIRTFGLL
ncbi:MAG: DUF2752 domain-containing protein [Clostridia bacterium]|nr:DUF2752 domain-containing protein [Clostridia bacterium]